MNAERQAKIAQVKEISKKLTLAKAMVIAEYAGLTVKELQSLRKKLKATGVEIKIYKNRLFKIAAKKANLDIEDALTGPNLYAFGMEDEISPAKVLAKFAKKHEALKLKSGTYEGRVIDAIELAEIAMLPSLEEALTMLAMSLMSPLKYISVGLNMLATKEKLEIADIETISDETVIQSTTNESLTTQTKEDISHEKEIVSVDEIKIVDSKSEDNKQNINVEANKKNVQVSSTLEQEKNNN